MPAGTSVAVRARVPRRVRPAACLAVAVVAAMAGCGTPSETASPAPVTCVDLETSQAVGLSWSQTGRYLALGTVGPDGAPGARVIDAEGRAVGARVDGRDLLPASVVGTPDGRLAWLESLGAGTVLVEDRADGRVETALPGDIDGLGWTAIGFALLEHPSGGGTRVLNLDVERPGEPTVSYATDRFAERLWISADPESLVLTIVHPDHRDAATSFQVVLAETEHSLEPAAADTSGASMPALRRWVVYHSAAGARMEAINVADPGTVVLLTDRPAQRGAVSDRGILAFVPEEPYGQLCLVDVASRLP